MAGQLDLGCRCGTVRLALLVPRRGAGTRVTCYCRDCRSAAQYFGSAESLLGTAGGTDIWQTTPDLLEIRAGADRLAILRLGPKGLFRWYAACCDTPLCNTLSRLGFPFVGMVLRPDQAGTAAPVLGPVTAHAFTASAPRGRGAPAQDVRFAQTGAALMQRALAAWLSGRARRNPLRGPDGGPVAPVHLLTPEERAAAQRALS